MAYSSQTLVSWAMAHVGAGGYSGKCQKFVADAYKAATGTRISASCAKVARNKWMTHPGDYNIPVGATVYFTGTRGDLYGHVGIYVGDGMVVHGGSSSGVKYESLEAIDKRLPYLGWGWNGNQVMDGYAEAVNISGSGTSGGTTGGLPITTVKSQLVTGTKGVHKQDVSTMTGYNSSGVEITIQNDKNYVPAVVEDVTLERPVDAPAKLTFTVLKDSILNIQEGNPVAFRYKGQNAFYGYIFEKTRSELGVIKITCYDQLRYFKNKDTFSYTGKKYGEVLELLSEDYGVSVGDIEDTGYTIPSRIEECTVLDMLMNASDETVLNTGQKYVLYDDFGAVCLKSVNSLVTNYLVDRETAESFDYTTSIDKDVYTAFKFAFDDSSTGTRYTVEHHVEEGEEKWGVLMYYEKVTFDSNSKEMNEALIREKIGALAEYYSQKNRSFTIKGAYGALDVRGGSCVLVNMNIGDIELSNFMYVDSVTHHFENGRHSMDMTLSGFNVKDISSDVRTGLDKMVDFIPESALQTVSTGGVTGGATGAMNLSGGAVEEQVFNFLVKTMGYSPAVACGIMGNIEAESEFNIKLIEKGTGGAGGFGLTQWTGIRRSDLKKWCSQNGYAYNTLEGQLAYFRAEMTTKRPGIEDMRGYHNRLRSMGNGYAVVKQAMYYFMLKYEKPNSNPKTRHDSRRENSAYRYWDLYGKNYSG